MHQGTTRPINLDEIYDDELVYTKRQFVDKNIKNEEDKEILDLDDFLL